MTIKDAKKKVAKVLGARAEAWIALREERPCRVGFRSTFGDDVRAKGDTFEEAFTALEHAEKVQRERRALSQAIYEGTRGDAAIEKSRRKEMAQKGGA